MPKQGVAIQIKDDPELIASQPEKGLLCQQPHCPADTYGSLGYMAALATLKSLPFASGHASGRLA